MSHRWVCRERVLEIGARPLVMGIVNVTPDSFSDGGRFFDPARAVEHAVQLVADGADLLDIGGESTRPGSQPVSLAEELARVIPVVREVAARTDRPISVDTSKSEVARQALAAGATMINDVTGLEGDPAMPGVARDFRAGVIVMHMQGTPATMQANPTYADVVREVVDYCENRLHTLEAAGIAAEQVALDPGIGFGKTEAHNLALIAHLTAFRRLGRPVCLGVSRKGFLGRIPGGRPVDQRLPGGLAVALFARAQGSAQILRVHDVRATVDALAVWEAVAAARGEKPAP